MFRWNQSFILFLIYFTSCACGYANLSVSQLINRFASIKEEIRTRFAQEHDNGHRNDFETVKLAEMWSPTACKNFRSKQHNSERACTSCAVSKAVNKWTIHGLWPSNGNNTGPYQCSGSKYEASLVNELRKELNEKWPSAMYDNDSFWSHEWKKHGTCSNLKATDTVTKYFSTSLRLFDAYNLGGILAEANILAGNNYTLDSLHGAIKRKLGVNVFVQCIRIKGKHEQYLSQVQLCFDKSLRLTDCDSGNGYLSSCERHYNVTYANSC